MEFSARSGLRRRTPVWILNSPGINPKAFPAPIAAAVFVRIAHYVVCHTGSNTVLCNDSEHSKWAKSSLSEDRDLKWVRDTGILSTLAKELMEWSCEYRRIAILSDLSRARQGVIVESKVELQALMFERCCATHLSNRAESGKWNSFVCLTSIRRKVPRDGDETL